MSGCVRETVDGETTVYSYESWTWLVAAAAGLGMLGLAWYLSNMSGWRRSLIALIGMGALVFAAPQLMTDRLEVDAEHFHVRKGLWINRTDQDVRFDDIRRMELTSSTRWTRRGKRKSYTLTIFRKAGEEIRIPVGGVMEEGLVNIADHARMHGVEVIDRTAQDE
jgi:hypothetical protein